MYKFLIRPFLFLFPPEFIHHAAIVLFRVIKYIPGKKALLRLFFMSDSEQLKKFVFGLEFKNPVGLAAGFDKNAEIFDEMECFGFSFVEIGTVTPLGQPGNPKPRLFRLKKDNALINRMGFNNKGLLNAVKKLKKRKSKIIVGGNIGKNTKTSNEKAIDDYIRCFNDLFPYVDYFTINVSCPNIKDLKELQEEQMLIDLLSSLKEVNNQKPKPKPLLLKVSPDISFSQLDNTINIVQQIGISGIVAVNTTIARNDLLTNEKKINTIGNGGLSGKPLKSRTIEIIKYISKKTDGQLPIIGVGGITNAEDALEMLNAGASLVQIYTGFIYQGPAFVKKINNAVLKNKLN